ncbi:hypothetical protein ACJIZ3_004798 [Penstemon smallii]|uniref:MICOS complex subunit MIC60 n=1 Tax=Penstemon smallii TaxID=265156 RepID=A0ABD3S3B8_9LAMI
MLRRSILQVASRGSAIRVPLRTTTQVPSYLSSRRAFSVSPRNEPPKPDSASNIPEGPKSKSNLPKIISGGLAVGSVLFAAYYYGVLDKYIGKEQQRIGEYSKADDKNNRESSEQNALHGASESSKTIATNNLQGSGISSSNLDHAKEDVESQSEVSLPEDSVSTQADTKFQVKDTVQLDQENLDHIKERELPDVPQGSMPSDDLTSKPPEESFDLKSPEVKPDEEQGKVIDAQPQIKTEIKSVPREQITTYDTQEVVQDDGIQISSSLLDDYYIKENSEDSTASSSSKHKDESSKEEDAYDGFLSKDGIVILDLLQAIHAAEKRQAELDARAFAEEKRAMEEKYEKELKDARVRELMYAEREAILDKEIIKERVKAAAALKSLQEKLEEKLKTELEQKEIEAEQKLKKMQDIAKAELAAAIASEKASQIEKMAEANLNINALCMAFYARSEEARQSHSIHKLALGALAVEDSLAKGLPIQKEIEALQTNLEGIDKDSLIALVLSSLPEDTQKHGTDTLAQLNHKFEALKGTLRHFSLIPPSGGGILAHSLAHIASFLKVKEVDQSGDGIESLINKVDNLLAQGELCAAADALENGVKGSQAAEVVDDWVKRARNRAITEQALMVLQSYATTVSLT